MEYPSNISTKLPKVSTTIFSVMSALAKEHNAYNLSQGFPDFEVSPKLIEHVHAEMRAGFNQYAPMEGAIELREQVAIKTEKLYGAHYNPEKEVTITAGGTQALYTAFTATIREEDEVILFTPAYDSYAPAIELCGGKPIYVPLEAPHYKIDWNEVKKLINRRTRMIVINTPHNPTGTIFSADDMAHLESITRDNDIIILSDEVYEHTVLDGFQHQSIARYPKLAERSFIIGSFGKTFNVTGWKVGFCLAPTNLMREFRKVHQYMVFSVNTPIQRAIAEFLKDENNYIHIPDLFQEKRDFFIRALNGSRFKVTPTQGTYFQLLNYSNISDEKDTEFAKRLTVEHKVASIPVSVFYHNPTRDQVLRFCFAKQEETLEKAADILCRL
ncbi:MAG: aminotransferase [Crocinitomicaceae bacterium]|nr:aminotransferase [Crocinitomicaceae bacterium]